MKKDTWSELVFFIREQAVLSNKKDITKSLTLEGDLGITGEDAEDFMRSFFERFKVDQGDFVFERYFNGEGFQPFGIIAMIFSKKIRKKYEKEKLTLGMLEAAILRGVWESEKLGS